MLTLINCANDKHDAWWDFEAEIQRELDALDADEDTYASGNPQMEVMEEKEIVTTINQVADDFKNLMNRFSLQNEKLLHIEQSIFSLRKCTEAFEEDSSPETAHSAVDPHCGYNNYSSRKSFLTQEHLIRPLYCIDDCNNLSSYGKRSEEENENERGCIDYLLEDRTLMAAKVQKDNLIVGRMKKPKSLPLHGMERAQMHRNSIFAEKVKDGLLHDFHLICKLSISNELKLEGSHPKSHEKDFLSNTPLTMGLHKTKKTALVKLEEGRAGSFNCFQAGFSPATFTDALAQFMKITDLQSINISVRKGPVTIFLPTSSEWEVFVVFNKKHHMTRIRLLKAYDFIKHVANNPINYKQFDMITPAGTVPDHKFSEQFDMIARIGTVVDRNFHGPCTITSYIPHTVLSLLLQLSKAIVKLSDEIDVPYGKACPAQIFQELSLICRQPRSGCASGKADLQLVISTKHKQVVDAATPSAGGRDYRSGLQFCASEHARAWGYTGRASSQEKKEFYSQSGTCCLEGIVKLQAVVRGFVVRQQYGPWLETEKKKLSLLATKIQACWRGHLCRKAYPKMVESETLDNVDDRLLQPYLRRISILQALVRGFLARKQRTFLLQEKKNAYILVSRLQACWRGWRVRNSDALKRLQAQKLVQSNAVIKVQALWRGYITRERFQKALEGSKYNDADDFEYALVDESDYLPKETYYEELSGICHQKRTPYDSLLTIECSAFEAINERRKEDEKDLACRKPVRSVEEVLVKEDPSANLCSFQKNLADHDNPTSDNLEELSRDEQGDISYDKKLGEKSLQNITETKAAIAEIAKDWGFKEEKTALQFIRALNNTRRQAESRMAPKPDSQARLRKFIARIGRHKEVSNKTNN